jgi:LDH2 family malate/lactate/ureidoglycolate dehydrogenase
MGGVATPALHTNPIAIAVPGSSAPLYFDMATSAVAQGKVALGRAAGASLRVGLIVDSAGQTSTDPK